ncbi:acyl esterase [Pseudoclavibacter endophyticus]|uniref:CocE/NonD family hydrolase n=1 Tax=Pseudoclavibacter endophyticus TaxID=1778590 RepID=A0A6H9WJ64_9MICO|nr:CocE/NonD family hydrolase [Pseudoclavibacter endophyticus]KAB1646853.1 CocE/NonD family hydrolase [Pseudoclavibacter endophyticus]GGA75009.1 acyl esterase [Pseudoclavibacter endophyticus]
MTANDETVTRGPDGVIDRPGADPTNAPGKPPLPPLRHEIIEHGDFVQEKDVALQLRDGVTIYLDLYRPRDVTGDLPVLLAWGPYGKHNTKAQLWPGAGIEDGWMSERTGFEAPDPAYWCAHGYAIANVDPRGLWNSEGEGRHNGPQEAADLYDTIEWLGAADWSNGKVGMLGVSYLAGAQFIAAAMKPPSLAAISPWECFTDWYREFAFHGGIPETGFIPRASANMAFSRTRTEDTAANVAENPLLTDYYRTKEAVLEDIEVPAYVVASWSDHGLHSRGTLEAFARISSTEKWLEVHGQKKWAEFYRPERVERQREFFDHYLRGIGDGPRDWPRVRLEVRDTAEARTHRSDLPWPVDESRSMRMHADFANGLLSEEPVAAASSIDIDSQTGEATVRFTFDEDTDVVGPMRLRLWLETIDGADGMPAATDADVFAVARKFRADGSEVRWAIGALFDDGPVALGWLRASHRALDESASSELRPVHPHDAEVPLEPGVPTPLDIELWPSATRFHAGEQLAITVLGHDFLYRDPDMMSPVTRHTDLRNRGAWRLHSGGERDAHLALLAMLAGNDDEAGQQA